MIMDLNFEVERAEAKKQFPPIAHKYNILRRIIHLSAHLLKMSNTAAPQNVMKLPSHSWPCGSTWQTAGQCECDAFTHNQ